MLKKLNVSRHILALALASGLTAQVPEVHESDLRLTLFAEDPDIVTPVGMVVGKDDKVYVIESHTHNRPSDYKGPTQDIVKVFEDRDKDGVAESFTVFAKGFDGGMNLAFSEDGILYILCAWSLYALPDRDGDGVCDEPELILTLDTEAGNPHGCWLGITFDDQNYMYLSRGNVGGMYYRVEGSDGSVVEGYGDGGNVIRAKADGTELKEWATGFWNSMDLKFDHKGNLLLIDNDPDGRGPNRLLRVVEGGDYGHIHMFGGWGRHPFQGWDGSFPGHLPFLSGTGEAPSGILDVSGPGEHSVLITVWNENTIERHTFLENGEVEKSIFMSGGKDFRPVALDLDSEGNLLITDWVLVDYPNHGRGRVWHVSKMPIPTPQSPAIEPVPSQWSVGSFLKSDDAFLRHSAEMWLADRERHDLARSLTKDADARVRLGAYLSLRRGRVPDQGKWVRDALADTDIEVRRFALLWASEQMDLSLRAAVDGVLTAGPVNELLFKCYLAAVEMVNAEFIDAFNDDKSMSSKKVPRNLEPGLLNRLAENRDLPSSVRALAIQRLDPVDAQVYLSSQDEVLLLAGIKQASSIPSDENREQLEALALNKSLSSSVRSEALLALSKQALAKPEALAVLLSDPDPAVANEAGRTLRFQVGNPKVRSAFEKLTEMKDQDDGLKELAEVALYGFANDKPFGKRRPSEKDGWISRLSEGGNPERGSRVFRSTQVMCSNCHAVDGVGTNLGPDLGGIAQSITRAQIVRAILDPSESFPPQYQAWNIYTTDGKVHPGLQIDHQARGAMLLYTLDHVNRRFEADEILNYEASPYSLMPPGLENTMTVSEFNDLVAYLSSLD